MAALGVTMATLVDETRDHLLAGRRAPLNRLETGIDVDDEFLTLQYDASQVRDGAYLAIDDEVIYVWAVSGQRADILRGQRGTAAAVHEDGATIEVEPRFPSGVILRTLQREIQSWPEDLYAVDVVTASVGIVDDAVALALTGTQAVHRLLQVELAPDDRHDDWWPLVGARLTGQLGAYSLAFGRELGVTTDVRIHLARAFDLSDLSSSTDVGDVGLAATMLDIPSLGAAARLVTASEVERTDDYAASSSQDAGAVPAGHRLRTGATLWQLREDRLGDERRRLLATYPYGLALT